MYRRARCVVVVCSLVALAASQRFDAPPRRRPPPNVTAAPTPPPPSPPPPPPPTAAPPPLPKTKSAAAAPCERKNARYPVPGQCDAYVQCKNFIPYDMTCPEGLHFNAEAPPNVYPCGYPLDVPCRERSLLQAAQPTVECPHRYGYFKSEGPLACGSYRACVDGHAFSMQCAAGLAWNQAAYKCDWPDQVPECDAEAFLGFRCPAVNLDENGGAPINRFYSHPTSCFMYFDCLYDKPRLLSCDDGLAFDALLGHCVEAELVPACHR